MRAYPVVVSPPPSPTGRSAMPAFRNSAAAIFSAAALAALAALAACKGNEPIPHTPTHLVMVSGANQSAGVSQALDSMLVVQVLDGANRAVANVPLTWTVTGGGA